MVEYAIVCTTNAARFPIELKLQGSDDGATWETLDHRTGLSWTIGTTQTFAVGNIIETDAHHRIWRIAPSANNGDGTYVGSQRVELRLTLGGTQGAKHGVVSYSGAYAAGYDDPFLDSMGASGWLVAHGNTWPEWAQYDFGDWPQAVVEYSVGVALSGSNPRSFKDWTFQHSDDNSVFTTVDTITGETSWGSGEVRVFTL